MKIRDIIFWLHLIAGVALGAVIGVMAVTGVLLSFEPQIVDLSEHNLRYVDTQLAEEKLPLSDALAKVTQDNPDVRPNSVTISSNPQASLIVNLGREEGNLYVNPYTGQVLGKGSKVHELMHQIEDIHRWLGSREIGKPITGVAVVAFFILLISGIFVWVPNKAWKFKSGLKGKARNWNWHNVIGIWCAPILLVTILTGMIMAHSWANDLLYYATGNKPPAVMRSPREEASSAHRFMPVVDLDAVLKAAQEKASGWKSILIRFPKEEGKPVNITIQEKLAAGVTGRSQLTLDSKTLEVIKWEPLAQANLGMKARMWVKYLHTGQAFGPLHQLLMAFGALGAIFLVWTGFAMAWVRFFRKKV